MLEENKAIEIDVRSGQKLGGGYNVVRRALEEEEQGRGAGQRSRRYVNQNTGVSLSSGNR